MPKYFNVHRTNVANLESLLNEHSAKGYDLRYIYRAGNQSKELLVVLFERTFETDEEWVSYAKSAAHRREARAVKAAPTEA